MTEQEWLACDNPRKMLEFLRGEASNRKLQLLMVAACYLNSPKSVGEEPVLEVVVRFADGQTTREDVRTSWGPAGIGRKIAWPERPEAWAADFLARCPRSEESRQEYQEGYPLAADLARLFRDLFGPIPFRPVALKPAWRTATVTGLARAIYEDRAFDRLPILGDALEEAGCTHADILRHCRFGGEHVRGCWVVDLVLGKE